MRPADSAASPSQLKLVQTDADGNVVWEGYAPAETPAAACRLCGEPTDWHAVTCILWLLAPKFPHERRPT